MAKKNTAGDSSGGDLSIGTEAWNVADGYTKIKILRLLIQLDRYDTLSQFGTEEIDQDVILDDNQLARRRYESIYRFVSCLKQLMGNVRFALRKGDFQKLKDYDKKIKLVESVIDGIADKFINDITKEESFIINENHFSLCLKILQEVKDELNFPINNAGLIFRTSEEIDLDKIMSDIVEGG